MPSYNGDHLAAKSRGRSEAERLPVYREQRPYFCRTCGKTTTSTAIPEGWYMLSRSLGGFGTAHKIGVYCTVKCLIDMMPRIVGIDRDLK